MPTLERAFIAKAWAIGAAVLVLLYGTWFVSLYLHVYASGLVLLLWLAPALSSFVTSLLAPRSKFALGFSMALLAALLASILNLVYERLGHEVDLPGISGAAVVFGMTLVSGVLLAGLGAATGAWFTRGPTM